MSAGSLTLAWGLTIAASTSTLLGAAFVVFYRPSSRRAATADNGKLLCASLGAAAGVMLYVAVAELFGKAEAQFVEGGDSESAAKLHATLSFFGGAVFLMLSNAVVQRIAPNAHHARRFRRGLLLIERAALRTQPTA